MILNSKALQSYKPIIGSREYFNYRYGCLKMHRLIKVLDLEFDFEPGFNRQKRMRSGI